MELRIFKGVPSAASLGLTSVTDLIPEVIDLVNGDFRLVDQNGIPSWTPKIATIKNNGTRADSAVTDGSELLTASVGNVIETMTLITGANTTTVAMKADTVMRLQDFARAAREFTIEAWQEQPVYLAWLPAAGVGWQYALIINIDIDISRLNSSDANDPPQLTIAIEREPYWRPVAPGDNPKKWTFEQRGLRPTSGASPSVTEYNHTHLTIYGGAYSLPYTASVEGAVLNYMASNIPGGNYLDIPASLIPGDAPALCYIAGDIPGLISESARYLFISRTTRRDYLPADGVNKQRFSWNGGDASLSIAPGTATKPNVSGGIISNGSTTLTYVAQLAFSGAGTGLMTWAIPMIQVMPGRYRVFVRNKVTSGIAGNITMRASYNGLSATQFVAGVTTGAATWYDIVDLGVLDLSLGASKTLVTTSGIGVLAPTITADLMLSFVATAAVTIQVADIIFIPLENSVLIERVSGSIHYDNTGYLTRGQPQAIAVAPDGVGRVNVVESRGIGITLVPRVNNRIWFFQVLLNGSNTYAPVASYPMHAQVLPRWSGVRNL
jgi:hypothetical protein